MAEGLAGLGQFTGSMTQGYAQARAQATQQRFQEVQQMDNNLNNLWREHDEASKLGAAGDDSKVQLAKVLMMHIGEQSTMRDQLAGDKGPGAWKAIKHLFGFADKESGSSAAKAPPAPPPQYKPIGFTVPEPPAAPAGSEPAPAVPVPHRGTFAGMDVEAPLPASPLAPPPLLDQDSRLVDGNVHTNAIFRPEVSTRLDFGGGQGYMAPGDSGARGQGDPAGTTWGWDRPEGYGVQATTPPTVPTPGNTQGTPLPNYSPGDVPLRQSGIPTQIPAGQPGPGSWVTGPQKPAAVPRQAYGEQIDIPPTAAPLSYGQQLAALSQQSFTTRADRRAKVDGEVRGLLAHYPNKEALQKDPKFWESLAPFAAELVKLDQDPNKVLGDFFKVQFPDSFTPSTDSDFGKFMAKMGLGGLGIPFEALPGFLTASQGSHEKEFKDHFYAMADDVQSGKIKKGTDAYRNYEIALGILQPDKSQTALDVVLKAYTEEYGDTPAIRIKAVNDLIKTQAAANGGESIYEPIKTPDGYLLSYNRHTGAVTESKDANGNPRFIGGKEPTVFTMKPEHGGQVHSIDKQGLDKRIQQLIEEGHQDQLPALRQSVIGYLGPVDDWGPSNNYKQGTKVNPMLGTAMASFAAVGVGDAAGPDDTLLTPGGGPTGGTVNKPITTWKTGPQP